MRAEHSLKLALQKPIKAIFFFSRIQVRCNVLWFLDKHTIQYAAFSMVYGAFKLKISKEIASEGAGHD